MDKQKAHPALVEKNFEFTWERHIYLKFFPAFAF